MYYPHVILKVLLITGFACFPVLLFAQSNQTCCAKFASLATNSDFKQFHNLKHSSGSDSISLLGKMVNFATLDGKRGQAYHSFLPKSKSKKSNTWLFIFHEWWGLNTMIKSEADYWAAKLGIHVLAIDLYDGKLAQDKELAANLMSSLKPERAKAIIIGAAGMAGPKAHFGTLGWCLGGGYSMQAAILLGSKAKACIVYYGMPETDPKLLKRLHAPVLGIFAQKDEWINPEIVSKADKTLKSLKKVHTFISYPAGHAFANPSNPDYQPEYTLAAKNESESFLKSYLIKKIL